MQQRNQVAALLFQWRKHKRHRRTGRTDGATEPSAQAIADILNGVTHVNVSKEILATESEAPPPWCAVLVVVPVRDVGGSAR